MCAEVGTSLDDRWEHFRSSVMEAGERSLPSNARRANKPWISKDTLDLLDARRQARLTRQFELELDLRRQVTTSARRDRSEWLEQLVADGTWNAVKKLR